MEKNEKLASAFESIKTQIPFEPVVAVVLGSGLGDFADETKIVKTIDYCDIANFPQSTVIGHRGRFVFCYVEEVPTVIMQGRVHFYEGYAMDDVVLPIRLMRMMNAKFLFLTNAAGGLGDGFSVGDLMAISDQISCFVPSPLMGKNLDAFGTRFPDMSCVYDKELFNIIKQTAKKIGINLKEGVYCQLTGPAYETPAEIKMLKHLGADAVGMSTAVEAIVGKHSGMRIAGLSMISNLAVGISQTPLSHEEVGLSAKNVAPIFKQLLRQSIVEISKL